MFSVAKASFHFATIRTSQRKMYMLEKLSHRTFIAVAAIAFVDFLLVLALTFASVTLYMDLLRWKRARRIFVEKAIEASPFVGSESNSWVLDPVQQSNIEGRQRAESACRQEKTSAGTVDNNQSDQERVSFWIWGSERWPHMFNWRGGVCLPFVYAEFGPMS